MLDTILSIGRDGPTAFISSLFDASWSTFLWTFHAFLVLLGIMTPPIPPNNAPVGFPASGNGMWYTSPGITWANEFLPVGNGYLGAMVPGGTVQERTQLNIETMWSGGPFDDPSYNGGNKELEEWEEAAQMTQSIRDTIFFSPRGEIDNIEGLTTPQGAYGSFAGSGYLFSNLLANGSISEYGRWLDLDKGLARTKWSQDGNSYLRTTFCSHSNQACVEHISSDSSSGLPLVTYVFSSAPEIGLPTPNVTCLDSNTLSVRGRVSRAPTSMIYELLFRAAGSSVQCKPLFGTPAPNATLLVAGGSEAWVTWVGATDYSIDAGDAAHNFTFRGDDPHANLVSLISSATSYPYQQTFADQISSYNALLNENFALSLGHIPNLEVPTNVLKARYKIDEGDPYLEWLTFNFGRYLLASSAPGILPSNLQGVWGNGWSNAWGADYHANINTQMNYWSAETTNLNVTRSLFNYMEKTWVPRGQYTAQVLYNISRGWVTHNEMNIFGHTGMKGTGGTALWANYPESNAWMMLHVWDHFDYTLDKAWWRSQGWPLLKGVAQFHLDKLIPDLYFNDSTLVVAPCNSPEQWPITFGCAHAQQVIWQLFNAVEKGFAASGDNDYAFLEEVQSKRAQMDKGVHIGFWGQLKEWKIEKDDPTNTHRHLSHLIGLYPGYAVASYDPGLQGSGRDRAPSKYEILRAASTSLLHRGNGTGPDGDAGWEKAWRAASWAQLGSAERFYHELTFGWEQYALYQNFGNSLLSLYDPYSPHPIFQIDANLGYPAAVMNALIQMPDTPTWDGPLELTLLPAVPRQWSSGLVFGARLRSGMSTDLAWDNRKPIKVEFKVDEEVVVQRQVRVIYAGKEIGSFVTSPGYTVAFTHF